MSRTTTSSCVTTNDLLTETTLLLPRAFFLHDTIRRFPLGELRDVLLVAGNGARDGVANQTLTLDEGDHAHGLVGMKFIVYIAKKDSENRRETSAPISTRNRPPIQMNSPT